MRTAVQVAILLGLLGPPAAVAPAEPPPPPAPAAPGPPSDPPSPPEEILGAPAAFSAESFAEERLPVAAGTPLRERPDPRSPALATVDAPSELPVVERRQGWALVRYGALRGWVASGDGEAAPGPVTPAARSADAEILARAAARLGPEAAAAPGRLGPFFLRTDVPDPDLLAFLARVAADAVRVYRERYALEPGLDPAVAEAETVVLFAREADYRAFTEEDVALAGLEEGGFAGFGLAALYLGARDPEEAASLLVHELVHLLNARALGPRTPAWLEEGLANDLAYARIDPSGRLDPASLGGRSRVQRRLAGATGREGWEVTVTTVGGLAALGRVIEALDRRALPPLAALTAMTWRELVDPAARELAYAESAFFVRYLLESPGLAGGFQAYLQAAAAGGEGGSEELAEALGEGWDLLEPGFRRWLRARALAGTGGGVPRPP